MRPTSRLPVLLCLWTLCGGANCWSQPYARDARTLLLDHLDETFTPDGQRTTTPAAITASGDWKGGRPGRGGVFVLGKFGQALQFHGLMALDYPGPGNVNLSAGRLEFWVALDFNTAEVKKDPGVLSNQLFATIRGPGASQVCVYSTLGYTNVAVMDSAGQLVCHGNFAGDWVKGEWHHLQLRWGQRLELWCDGRRQVAKDWFGLFGPLDVRPDQIRLSFGSHIGFSTVESEFLMDEIRILGPGGDEQPDHPVLTVPRLARPPVIDGELDAEEWATAARTTGFVGLNDHALVEDQTVVYLGWDEAALYVAFECLDPRQRPLQAALKDRDSAVYSEDAVDVILQPQPEPSPHYQFICNAIGTVYDSRVDSRQPTPSDVSFNPACEFRTSAAPGRWVMECRIPFGELDGRQPPEPGERWRANFCRDADSGSRLSSWSYAAGNFHTTANYGELVFAADDRAMRLADLTGWEQGQLDTTLSLSSFDFQPLVTVTTRLVGPDAKPVSETENRLADYRAVAVKSPRLVTGLYNLLLEARTEAGVLYAQRLPFRVAKPYDIAVEGYPYAGKLLITANVGGLGALPEGLVARSRLLRDGEVVARCETTTFVRGLGEAAMDIRDLPPGRYTVESEAVAGDGAVLGTAQAEFEQFDKPAWWRSQVGLDHTVPWPWTPVQSDGQTIRVLGREYRCGSGSLPRQIISRGTPILAAPVRLQLVAGGRTLDLATLPAEDVPHPEDAVVRQSRATAGALDVALQVTTEFDGLQRYDLTFLPREAASVGTLTLEIPLRRECAVFLLPSNGHSSTTSVLGDQPWRSSFMPQVWVGNDDLGLAWCAESDQFWRPRDDQMIEVVPEADRATLRCRIIRHSLPVTAPITITFALVATPVKDGHGGDPFFFRFGPGQAPGALMEFLRYPGAGNVPAEMGTLEFWLSPTEVTGGTWRDVVALTAPDASLRMWYLNAEEQQLQIELKDGQETRRATFGGFRIPAGEFRHVALTWGPQQVTVYVDGKRAGALDQPLPPRLFSDPGKLGLRFGCASEWQGYTQIAVDEVRVSNTQRYQGDAYAVPTAAFAPDAATVLLDHLDAGFRPDGEDAETAATVISGQSQELGGTPSIGCRFVPGKFGSGLRIATAPAPTVAQVQQQYGANASLFWFWLESDNGNQYGWPSPLFNEPRIPGLRDQVKVAAAAGMRPSTYMAYPAIGSPSPLSRQFGAEWSRRPLSTQPAEPPPGHYFWDVCANSGFADYIAAGGQWIMDDLGFEGCYTDGVAHPYPCQNTHHGCGYVDEEGRLHSTNPIFATRELVKRLYKVCHRTGAKGYLVNHISFDLFYATDAFSDVLYSGEHENYEDLTKFRVRWQSGNSGIWTHLLGPDSHTYEPLHMTYCLLHGVSVWPQGFEGRNDAFRKTAALWQAYDRFGYREAQWIPYYRLEQRNLVRSDIPHVRTSLYLRPGERALLVVANLKPEVTSASLALDLGAMGLRTPGAHNALTDQVLPLERGKLAVRLRPNSFVLVWVE
ncbi:MAG: hypothetical protein HPY69_00520 [Armatimonadetes bacterium]|nr:hypothetical protein [Armatimonadota bacterium]